MQVGKSRIAQYLFKRSLAGGKQTSLLKIILYFIGGGGHKHSDGQRNEITESSNTERTNEELIQSRSIDHLLCGGDGNKPRYKNLVKLLVSKIIIIIMNR